MGGVNFEENTNKSLGLTLRLREVKQESSWKGVVWSVVKPAATFTLGALFIASVAPVQHQIDRSVFMAQAAVVSAVVSVSAMSVAKTAIAVLNAVRAKCQKTA